MRISINGTGRLTNADIDALVDDMVDVADKGFGSYWLAQIGLVDALTVFALAGARGANIEMGTAVVPTYSRHPFTLAGQALTTSSALPGKLVLGIGLSHKPVIENRYRQLWEAPIRHMKEYLDVLDGLLGPGSADTTGETFSFNGAYPTPGPTPSVMIAAMGPQMLRLTGRRADGTILWMTGEKTVSSYIVPTISKAAEQAGRPTPRVVVSLPVLVTDDATDGRALISSSFGTYGELPSYRAMLDREGASGPAEVSLVGNEDELAARLAAFSDAGTTDFAAVEVGHDDEGLARTRAFLADYAKNA